MTEELAYQRNAFDCLLKEWEQLGSQLPTGGIGLYHKVFSCVIVYLKFEEVGFFGDKDKNPYAYMSGILKNQIEAQKNLLFLIDEKSLFEKDESNGYLYDMEQRHQDLWQHLFNRYSEDGYEKLIESMSSRFEINGLADKVTGKRCLDIGCGGGRQCVSLSRLGAVSVTGIDFGTENIHFANKMRDKLGIKNIEYREGNAYNLPFIDNMFDIVSSNGVFHHLERMDRALKEVHRVLKPGGWMWLYVNGAGGMFNCLMDAIKTIMRGTDRNMALNILGNFRLNEHKMMHLIDGFYATYKYSRWTELTALLERIGFKEIRRMTGIVPTDFNLDQIKRDPFGDEKFGEGEIRLVAFK